MILLSQHYVKKNFAIHILLVRIICYKLTIQICEIVFESTNPRILTQVIQDFSLSFFGRSTKTLYIWYAGFKTGHPSIMSQVRIMQSHFGYGVVFWWVKNTEGPWLMRTSLLQFSLSHILQVHRLGSNAADSNFKPYYRIVASFNASY